MTKELRESALNYVEELSEKSESSRKSLHFSEDNLVNWLVDFASHHCSELQKRIEELERENAELKLRCNEYYAGWMRNASGGAE